MWRGEVMQDDTDWKAAFIDLLDEVEQIPHPMAEEAWESFHNEYLADEEK
jgi:hypothetical protein